MKYQNFCFLFLFIVLIGCSSSPPKNQTDDQDISFQSKLIEYQTKNPMILIDLDGKIAYEAIDEDGSTVVILDGNKVDHNFVEIKFPKSIGGKLAFLARESEENRFVAVVDNQVLGREYWTVNLMDDLGGQPALTVLSADRQKSFVSYGGKDISEGYASSVLPSIIGGKVTFGARKLDGELVIVHGEEEYGEQYDLVNTITDLGGKLGYVAKDGDKNYVVYENKKEKNGYDLIFTPRLVKNKVTYQVRNEGKEFIVHGTKELGKEFDRAYSVQNINNKLVFFVEQDGKSSLWVDGKRVGEQYDTVKSVEELENALAYVARSKGKEFVVYNDKVISDQYDSIFSFSIIGNKLTFVGEQENQRFLVTQI